MAAVRLTSVPRLVAVLLALAAAAGCGSGSAGSSDAPTPSDDVVRSSPDDTITDLPGGPVTVVPAGEPLEDVRARPWERAEVVDGGRAVLLTFSSGVEACVRLDRVEAERAPDGSSVRLTLYEGTVPDAPACPEVALTKVTRVALAPPLPAGGRVEDGATG